MNCKSEILSLIKMSQAAGIPVDYTQGGGGNTSVKIDDNIMAIKASGIKLKHIDSAHGYVLVDYKNIKKYYQETDFDEPCDKEKESKEIIYKNTIESEGTTKLRPSVEAGFHSLLKKYVIHTHSVYANMLCCSYEGKMLVESIFRDKKYTTVWMPYVNPGNNLTVNIARAITELSNHEAESPLVFFLENHGLIVSDDECDSAIVLHQDVNDTIKMHFGLTEAYPDPILVTDQIGRIMSNTKYLTDVWQYDSINHNYFDTHVLYPDQLVYLNGAVSFDSFLNKVHIDIPKGEIVYDTGLDEARTIEETLIAYFFVIKGIRSNNLTLKTMNQKEIDFIINWESEAYRRAVSSKDNPRM